MKFSYDLRYDIAYIRFMDKPQQVESIKVSEELVMDVAPDGTVSGIELLNANEQLRAGDDGALVVVNEAIGDRREIRLIG